MRKVGLCTLAQASSYNMLDKRLSSTSSCRFIERITTYSCCQLVELLGWARWERPVVLVLAKCKVQSPLRASIQRGLLNVEFGMFRVVLLYHIFPQGGKTPFLPHSLLPHISKVGMERAWASHKEIPWIAIIIV